MNKEENGMSLVEVLATLVLVSLVIALVWTTVLISMKYNFVETKNLRWQQEANRVITEIQQYHRSCDTYDLTATHQEIKIEHCMVNGVDQGTKQIAYDFYYEIYVDEDLDTKENKLYSIDAKGYKSSFDLTLIVRDSVKESPKLTIDTKISRYQHN
ncbi:prepilin-type N-terminal cleavage/methylation domain-containing protein [Sporosarcina luteola]|uniref:prepilin-type N-terminal cleavage/methylation domain-containing protein n=1 Tax=Sporosarcina luteola TaxID=582850 RepID=UPI00204008D9|nr:prepilin-type N-terminal cleavage/methylation domain-containing protein [Sporosarcina luteola]MCM3637272.1 prepilin-type N-terminal cleavage/methylation domain-containing protein [Sporosarcina luteola]